MRRLSDEQGFTLIEMLVSATLGLIVLGALLGLLQTAQHSTANTTRRTDAAQRGRLAMEQMVQGLRSQVCLQAGAGAAQTTIVSGDKTSVTFFSGIDAPSTTTGLPKSAAPKKRTYTYANGKITETAIDGTYVAATGLWDFSAAPRTRTIADAVTTPKDGTVFSYYVYLADGTLDPTPMAPPLQPVDLPRIAQVGVSFVAKPSGPGNDPRLQTKFDDRVTLRLLFPAPKTALQNRTAACVI